MENYVELTLITRTLRFNYQCDRVERWADGVEADGFRVGKLNFIAH